MMIRLPIRQLAAVTFISICGLLSSSAAQAPTGQSAQKDGSIVVVLDNSKAARKSFRDMRAAVNTFVRALGDEDEVALVTAGDRPVLVQDFTSDESVVEKQLPKLKTTDGALALAQAVTFAANHASQDASNSNPAVVVFASGADAQSVSRRANQASPKKPVPVYVIASPKSDWKAQQELQQLASNSGGAAFFPSSNSEFRDVVRETALRVAGPPPDPDEAKQRTRGLLKNYSTVLVRSIPLVDNGGTTEAEGGENLLLQEVLLARLRKANIFSDVVDAKDLPAGSAENSARPGTAELLATVLEYRRGNRAQRQLLGWKGGAKFKVRVIMVDAATHQPILSFTEEGSHSSGLLGGTQEHVQARAMLNVVNEIVRELKLARQQISPANRSSIR